LRVNNNRRGKLTETEKLERMINVAELYYNRSLGEKEIAEAFGYSSTHISRILKLALENNIIEITINRQHIEKIRQKVLERFRLLDVRLTPHVTDIESSRKYLAADAARYFDECVPKDHSKVGISGGRTMHKLVELIESKPRRIKIYPLTGLWRDLHINYVDSGALVHSVWSKCMDAAEAFWFPIEPIAARTSRAQISAQRQKYLKNPLVKSVYRAANNVDFALIGVGPLRKKSSTINQLKNLGITYEYLKKRGAVGIAAGVWFNRKGEPAIDDYFLSVPLQAFRKMSKESGKKVVVVASGDEKVEAIRIFLESGNCNVLLTDSRTASKLLQ